LHLMHGCLCWDGGNRGRECMTYFLLLLDDDQLSIGVHGCWHCVHWILLQCVLHRFQYHGVLVGE